MIQICPKCSQVLNPNEQGNPGVCPACGVIFAKYLETTAKRDAAKVAPRPRAQTHQGNPISPLVKILLLVVLIAGAVNLYLNHRNATPVYKHVSLPILADANKTSEQFEFNDLFDRDTTLSNLATPGHYTVVEVYLDQCTYCRELESALVKFQDQRKDVDVVRVHHPGHMSANVRASTREELNQKMQALNDKMSSYQLCGSPHVEVYGPDKQALGLDTCKSRGGTAFIWNWITSETGITRRSAPGASSPMT